MVFFFSTIILLNATGFFTFADDLGVDNRNGTCYTETMRSIKFVAIVYDVSVLALFVFNGPRPYVTVQPIGAQFNFS